MATGAIAIAAQAVLQSTHRDGPKIEGFYIRPQEKAHGTNRLMEGRIPPPGTAVAIVDDVVTTGNSLIRAADQAQNAGLDVRLTLAVVKRTTGPTHNMDPAHYHFHALIQI